MRPKQLHLLMIPLPVDKPVVAMVNSEQTQLSKQNSKNMLKGVIIFGASGDTASGGGQDNRHMMKKNVP